MNIVDTDVHTNVEKKKKRMGHRLRFSNIGARNLAFATGIYS